MPVYPSQEVTAACLETEPGESLWENAPLGIFQSSFQGELLSVNKAMARMYGYACAHEMLGTVKDVARDMFVGSKEYGQLWDRLQDQVQVTDFECLQKQKDGKSFWASISVRVFQDREAQGRSVLGYVLDVTERKKLKQELQDKAQRLQERFKELSCIYQISRSLQKKTSLQETLQEVANIIPAGWQYPEAACCRIELDSQIVVSDGFQEPEIVISQEILVQGSFRGKVQVGYVQEKTGLGQVSFLQEEVSLLAVIAENLGGIIERKMALEEVKQKKEELQRSIAEKDQFFSIIAHDLRSPISGFLSLTEFMSQELQELSQEEIQNMTWELKASAQELHELLENLLEWSRIQRGKISYRPQVLDLQPVVLQNLRLVAPAADSKEVQVQDSVPPQCQVLADRHMLHCILRNLLFNAVKFTPRGGWVRISAEPQGSWLQLSVQDTGTGMDQDMVRKLFHLGQKVQKPGTEGEKGSGLGLLLSQEFVHKHGGSIWVNSSPKQGSIFYFTLPGGGQG
ncbi:MAG: ATP-binding protein [Desulfohalobiaceae bacterium]